MSPLDSDEQPILVAELELGGGPGRLTSVGPRTGATYDRARILVRLHGTPLGFVRFRHPAGELDPARVRRLAFMELGDAIAEHLAGDGIAFPQDPVGIVPGEEACSDRSGEAWHEPLTVVVCSRDRPTMLAACLVALKELRYDRFEVVVVDNAPSSDMPAGSFRDTVGDDPRFRLVVEPRPGLSRARNRGLAEASYAHVAFTDDDVLVDPSWLEGIARGFARDPMTGCVTGFVPSAQLDTPSQRRFDERVWWSSSTDPHVYDLDRTHDESRLFPFDAGRIGTGANFAVDRDLILDLGGFDEALGAGSPTRGGEDLDAFVRVLRAGRSIVFEPSAVVWHIHRLAADELRGHMHGYGVGLSAYITKYLADPATRGDVFQRIPSGVLHMLRLWDRPSGGPGSRSSLVFAEAMGLAAGPFSYWKARRGGWGTPI